MSRNFTHLANVTPYPGTDVNVYQQHENMVDYNSFTPETRVELFRVNWRNDYHDVIKFKDDSERDKYFDNLASKKIDLNTGIYITDVDSNNIKLPLPFAQLQSYNYMRITYTNQIQDNYANDAQKYYHYFITSMHADSSNTTTCIVQRDAWTDYINTTTIASMLASRTHEPLSRISVDKYLANPLENNSDLLNSDVNYETSHSKVARAQHINLREGARYYVLACTFSASNLKSMIEYTASQTETSASQYSDNTVKDFEWSAGGYNIHNLRGKTSTVHTIDNMTASNVFLYALPASTLQSTYFNLLFKRHADVGNKILASFIVTENMITLHDYVTVDGVRWYNVSAKNETLANITLRKSDFKYDAKYANITKLYTAPYSYLEVTDNFNTATRIEIADCGKLTVQSLVTLSYPILRQFAYLDGVQSNEVHSVIVNTVSGSEKNITINDSNIIKTLQSQDIPTYALQRSASDAYRANNYNTAVQQARNNAITAYHNTAESADTANTNSKTSASVALENTKRSTANTLNNTSINNAYSTNVYKRNTNSSLKSVSLSNAKVDDENVANRNKLIKDYAVEQQVLRANYEAQQDQIAATNVSSQVAQIATTVSTLAIAAGATVASGGTLAPVAIGGAMTSLAATGISVGTQGYNTSLTLSKNEQVYNTNVNALQSKATYAIETNDRHVTIAKGFARDITQNSIDTQKDLTTYAQDTATRIASNNVNTSNANAQSSYSNTVNNSNRSYDTTIANARRSLEQAKRANDNLFYDLANQSAQPVGAYSGDNSKDALSRNVMTVKVVTQSDSAIASAGEYFTRYGIAVNKYYHNPDLQPCKFFCYWQCDDVRLFNDSAQNQHVDTLAKILETGVTVWSNPDDMRKNVMYDNIK